MTPHPDEGPRQRRPSPEPLPALRRPRRLDIPKMLGRVFDAVAAIDAQVEPYAQKWDEWNEAERHRPGPLWVVYGDSSSQGIGATTWEHGWVPQVLPRLQAVTGESWRVINLSMSGARMRDVIEVQAPVAEEFLAPPELVTCVIGSNDLFWRPGETDAIVDDALELGSALPPGALLSIVGGDSPRRQRVRHALETTAARHELMLFDMWAWPRARHVLAEDRVHPSDLGYHFMAEIAWKAIGARLDIDAPLWESRGE